LSSIRVTYSGLISLLVSLAGVLTGTIFIIMVTRKLSPEELGLWTLITSVVGYVLIVEPIISYWTTRQIARGERVGKTALFTGGLFSTGGITVYFGIAFFVSFSLGVDLSVLLLASILVPLMFLHGSLSAISLGYKPQSESYGTMGFELSKIPIGIIFVVLIPLGIFGAILTVIIANVVRVTILLIMVKDQLLVEIKRQVIKFWLKMSWIPMYGAFPGLILTLDVLIFSFITNSLVGLAYWTVGITIAALVTQSGNISQALYPKLIATRKKEYAEENFKRTMFFAIPILTVSLILAKPLLHIINPLYVDGIYIVYFLSLKSFVAIFLNMSFNILRAYETVDLDKNASFKQYMKSKLFFVPTLHYIMSLAYVAILIAYLLLRGSETTDIDMVTTWSIIFFTVFIPFTLYGIFLIKKDHHIVLPAKSMIKFAVVAILASVPVYFASENMLSYTPSIWGFMPQVMAIVLLGGGIYFGLIYAIEVGRLSKELHKEFEKILGKLSYNNFQIFHGFSFIMLRQLKYLTQIERILQQKRNTVFILEGIYLIYPAMIKFGKNIGYESEFNATFLNGDKIEYDYFSNRVTNKTSRTSINRLVNAFKSNLEGETSVNKIIKSGDFLRQILSYKLKLTKQRIKNKVGQSTISSQLKIVKKKIEKSSAKNNAKCLFFITATRDDLYLKPLLPIMEKFVKSKIPFHIITGDLASGLMLSKNKLEFLNFYEEINILSNQLRVSSDFEKLYNDLEKLSNLEEPIGLKEIFPELVDLVYRSVATILVLEEVFKTMNLHSVVAAADGEMLEVLAEDVARKKSIPSYTVVPSAFNPHPVCSNWFNADKILVYGEHGKSILRVLDYDTERIIITGHPKFDFLKTMDVDKIQNMLTKEKIDPKNRIILIAMSKWNENDEKWISQFIHFCNSNNFEIIIKIHPMYKTGSHQYSESIISKIKDQCKELKFLITYDLNIYELILCSDLVITDFSNVGIEAILMEKPLITIDFSGQKKWKYLKISESNASIPVEKYDELELVSKEILLEDKYHQSLDKERKEIINNYNFYNDGKASERIFKYLVPN